MEVTSLVATSDLLSKSIPGSWKPHCASDLHVSEIHLHLVWPAEWPTHLLFKMPVHPMYRVWLTIWRETSCKSNVGWLHAQNVTERDWQNVHRHHLWLSTSGHLFSGIWICKVYVPSLMSRSRISIKRNRTHFTPRFSFIANVWRANNWLLTPLTINNQ